MCTTLKRQWFGMAGSLAVVGMVCQPCLANGFRNPPEGAAALGHNGGKLTLTEDASAVSHNPANLASMKEGQVLPSVTVIDSETDFTSAMGTAETEDPWKVLPNIFAAWPLENTRYVAGIGVTTPFGQSTTWKDGGVLHYSAPHFAEMKLVNVNPTLAARLNDRIAVGVGADAYWSQLRMKQWVPWAAMTGDPSSPDGELSVDGSGMAVGANAAVSVKVTANQTLALTYRSPFTVDYEGDTEVSRMPAPARMAGLSPTSDFDTSIDFPAVVAVGYGVKVSDTVRVGAEFEWAQFSTYDRLEIDTHNNNALANPSGAPTPATIPQNWDDAWTAGAGVDWAVAPSLTFRAGYIYLKSPVPEETLAPTLPDISRHVVSVGLGVRRGGNTLDLAYGYSIIPDREVDASLNPAYNGEYETSSHLFGVSYGHTF